MYMIILCVYVSVYNCVCILCMQRGHILTVVHVYVYQYMFFVVLLQATALHWKSSSPPSSCSTTTLTTPSPANHPAGLPQEVHVQYIYSGR